MTSERWRAFRQRHIYNTERQMLFPSVEGTWVDRQLERGAKAFERRSKHVVNLIVEPIRRRVEQAYRSVEPQLVEINEELGLRIATYQRGNSTLVVHESLATAEKFPLIVVGKGGLFSNFRISAPEDREEPIDAIEIKGIGADTRTEVAVRRIKVEDAKLIVKSEAHIPFVVADNGGRVELSGSVGEAIIGISSRLEATSVEQLTMGGLSGYSDSAKADIKGRIGHLTLKGQTFVEAGEIGIVKGQDTSGKDYVIVTELPSQIDYTPLTHLRLYLNNRFRSYKFPEFSSH
ncbi:MAG TPA: hypothetical protein VLF20_02585 [Patescibacteria group bacterium]|nr:hypothetical protein [Patescibacteria group bacterium]